MAPTAVALADALALLQPKDRDAALAAIEESAEGLRQGLAERDFRVKEVATRLAVIEIAAERLAGLVDEHMAVVPDLAHAAKVEFPDNDKLYLKRDPNRWAIGGEELRYLSEGASAARGEVVSHFGSGDPDKPDSGGGQGLMTRLYGTAKRRFVGDLADVWIEHRPDALAATHADFTRFVELCWTVAGQEGEPRGLDDDVKAALPPALERLALARELAVCEVLAANARRIGATDDAEENETRARAIRERLRHV